MELDEVSEMIVERLFPSLYMYRDQKWILILISLTMASARSKLRNAVSDEPV